MPLSARTIFTAIAGMKKPFTRDEIIAKVIQPPAEGKNRIRGKKRKKATSQRTLQRDTEKVNGILKALADSGFIVRHKKSFSQVRPLAIEGSVRINTSGNGIVEWNDDVSVIIKKGDVNFAHNNDRVTVELSDYHRGVFYGRVRSVVSTKHERFFAKLSRISGNTVYFQPLDVGGSDELCASLPGIGDAGKILDGKHFYLIRPEREVTGYTQNCTVLKSFRADDDESDILRVTIKNSLPEQYPPMPGLDELEGMISEPFAGERVDYRKDLTVTIDGDNAKDFDDAVSVRTSGKNYLLCVHIADVSAYVKKGSRLDAEAFRRGTSYYLGDTVIPMLPEKISNDLCSLREKVDRLTVTAEMIFGPDGTLIERKFCTSIIRVSKRLTYRIADGYLDRNDRSRYTAMLKTMHELSVILKRKRLRNGRLDLNLADVELVYENGKFREIRYSERLRSHSIIEEFMLSANEVVAEELTRRNVPSLYRVHEKISDENIDSLSRFVKLFSLKLKKSGNIGVGIQNMLDSARGNDHEHVVNLIVLKSLMQAYYGVEPLGHFGLGFENYTHFTSPIRRYPDLVVHRCLKSLLAGMPLPYSMNDLVRIGEQSSELERAAQNAERDLVKLKSCRFMKDRVGETFPGIVSGVVKSGFFVSLVDYPVEGMVPFHLLDDDYYEIYDDYSVIGRRTGRTYRLGQKVQVKLRDVKIDRMMIDFSVR